MNIYTEPEKFGLTTVGEIDWSDGSYQFDLTVVWKRDLDGAFVYADDSGCSCPVPFEDIGISDLTVLRRLEEFKAHCTEMQAREYPREDRTVETAKLLERMHAQGAR